MPYTLNIEDDFDMDKIRVSGQCFRVADLGCGIFRFVSQDKALFAKDLGGGEIELSCTADEWRDFWAPYFDMGRNYSKIRSKCVGMNDFADEAMGHGTGLRILRQDPWEMLITFIISQRKNMPAIANAVEAISRRFGSEMDLTKDAGIREFAGLNGICEEDLKVHAFPTPEQLAKATEDELRGCSLGYRAPYVSDAAMQVASGAVDLAGFSKLSDEDLFYRLQDFRGVGAKVSNCVCLFGYGRTSKVPVDVWISRAMEAQGKDVFAQFGDDAGIIQQYVFFHMTSKRH